MPPLTTMGNTHEVATALATSQSLLFPAPASFLAQLCIILTMIDWHGMQM